MSGSTCVVVVTAGANCKWRVVGDSTSFDFNISVAAVGESLIDELHDDSSMLDAGVQVGCVCAILILVGGSLYEVEAVDKTTSAVAPERSAKGRKSEIRRVRRVH